jgi:hypothetical protein
MGHIPTQSGVRAGPVSSDTQFKEGWKGGPGRPKGSRNRVKADLSQLIMDAATETGFIQLVDGVRVGTGIEGAKGFLKWCCLNERSDRAHASGAGTA